MIKRFISFKASCTKIALLVMSSLLFALVPTFSVAQEANSDRGKLLYENQCSECHDKSIHQKEDRRASSIDELRIWVTAWTVHNNLDWGMDEVDAVTLYLSTFLYKFDE